MKLKKFIRKNIDNNSVVRLVTNIPGGHTSVESSWDRVYMSWELEHLDYGDWEALCVTNIGGAKREAINIVVVDPNPYRNFINHLRVDEEMQRAYRDNVAMAFKDSFDESKSLHENANIAAERFIEQLIK